MRIDLSAARQTAAERAEDLARLDGREVDETPTRAGVRNLLRAPHFGDRASVQTMDVYYDFKMRDVQQEGDARRE